MTLKCDGHIRADVRLPYREWHYKAHESYRRGMRQQRCAGCGLYFFPWELTQQAHSPAASRGDGP